MVARTAEECDELFARYANAGDLDRLVGLYETDGNLVQQDGNAAHGRTAIRAALAGLVDMAPKLVMCWWVVCPQLPRPAADPE